MQVLVKCPDNKAEAFLDVLNSISFVKTKVLSKEKALFLSELSEAVEEVTQIKKGKKKARNVESFLNEL